MRSQRILTKWLPAIIAVISMTASATPDVDELPSLRDQFGDPVGLSNDAGQVQVVIVVSAKRLRRIKPWEKALRRDFPDLIPVHIADIPRDSPTDYDSVAEKLRKRLPQDLLVGIDMDGEWAGALGLDVSVPNVLVFDAAGELVHTSSSMYKKALYPGLQTAVADAIGAAPTGESGD